MDRLCRVAYWQLVPGSNSESCLDRDEQQRSTMSECQVKAVSGSQKSMMEPPESMGRRRKNA